MTDLAAAPPSPVSAEPAPDRHSDTGGSQIDPDDATVVPAALLAMITAVQETHRVLQGNANYPAIVAVGAVEDVVARLVRICHHLLPYVGDYSRRGATAAGRAEELLEQARAQLSSARHHVVIGSTMNPDPGVAVAVATV